MKITKVQTKEQLEKYLSDTHPAWWEAFRVGRKNMYRCNNCSHFIVTIEVDRGVTPMMLSCDSCTIGTRRSGFYLDGYQKLTPTHEWYRPDGDELLELLEDPQANDHYIRGGLSIRPVEDVS